ncbi:hypothetical protein RDWZM_001841 [Blomia tropicalis]|uniref:Uncharacterized protein n=1 Tax=Blomia tropicalis TaxID=40697 RepID=A0A9Q0RR09_BLOTA|nr:hypothetical protein RDWZM_001841 [Blomia tropicalis]
MYNRSCDQSSNNQGEKSKSVLSRAKSRSKSKIKSNKKNGHYKSCSSVYSPTRNVPNEKTMSRIKQNESKSLQSKRSLSLVNRSLSNSPKSQSSRNATRRYRSGKVKTQKSNFHKSGKESLSRLKSKSTSRSKSRQKRVLMNSSTQKTEQNSLPLLNRLIEELETLENNPEMQAKLANKKSSNSTELKCDEDVTCSNDYNQHQHQQQQQQQPTNHEIESIDIEKSMEKAKNASPQDTDIGEQLKKILVAMQAKCVINESSSTANDRIFMEWKQKQMANKKLMKTNNKVKNAEMQDAFGHHTSSRQRILKRTRIKSKQKTHGKFRSPKYRK